MIKILFLTLANVVILVLEQEFHLNFYTTAKTLLTIKQIEFINKKRFFKVVLDKNIEIFIIYMALFNIAKMLTYSNQ